VGPPTISFQRVTNARRYRHVTVFLPVELPVKIYLDLNFAELIFADIKSEVFK